MSKSWQIILRKAQTIEALTLDQAILDAWSIYYNGCALSLKVIGSPPTQRYFLGLGCYAFENPISGTEKLVRKYLDENGGEAELLQGENILKETILTLLAKTDNCRHCGGVVFVSEFNKKEKRNV